jgi:hypothetical protein
VENGNVLPGGGTQGAVKRTATQDMNIEGINALTNDLETAYAPASL